MRLRRSSRDLGIGVTGKMKKLKFKEKVKIILRDVESGRERVIEVKKRD